jgi:F0F1-type ATP synthase membrane subunit b/b'
MGMSASDTRSWAKEEILDAIDKLIKEKKSEIPRISLEEEQALERERDRVVKFLNCKTRK